MICRLFCALVFWIVLTKAVPADYVFEIKSSPAFGSCKLESRAGLTTDEISKTNPENIDVEDATEEDDLNRLLDNFWAVDDLPKQSAFVSIKKLPDVYLDEHDLPSPISDMMTVEQSEITEEAKDLQSPEFGEKPIYEIPMQPLDNVGKRNHKKYTNYMPFPQLPGNFQMYDDSYYYYGNNTMYTPEKENESCSGNFTDKDMKLGKSEVIDPTQSSEEKSTEKGISCTTSKPEEIEKTTTSSIHTTAPKIPAKNSTRCTKEETSTPKTEDEKAKKSDAANNCENIMKISAHKKDKKKDKI